MAVNWGALGQPVNALASYRGGVEAGQKVATERTRRNALATYGVNPEGALSALMTAGDTGTVNALVGTDDKLSTWRGRRAARPAMEAGDYAGAAKAAGGFDPELAAQISKMDADQKDRLYKMGQRSASVIMAAAQIPDPQQRRAYIGQYSTELTGLGLTPEQIANYDVTDPVRMRADAARFMEVSDIAGRSSVEKVGDYSVNYETNPVTGSRPVSKTLIPPTRAERLAEERFGAEQDYRSNRLALDREGLDLRRQEQENKPPTVSAEQGRVMEKVRQGVPLTAGEQEVWDYMQNRGGGFMSFLPGAAAPTSGRPTADRPPPSTTPPAGQRPPSSGNSQALPPAARQSLREGETVTFGNGQSWTLRNGQPVRVQ
jgi:hypothetical protein